MSMCSSSSTANHISSTIMHSVMSIHDSTVLMVMHMLGFPHIVCFMVVSQ